MANNAWKPMTLGEFTTLQRGHDLPEERRRTGQIPILGSFGITGWHDEARAAGPGVTVGRSGASFGVVSYSSIPYWPLNTALYVKDFHGNDERFAYYLLKTFDFKRYNSGSAQPSLNRNYIHPIRIDVPPLSEQRAIAHILGTLDDKIELNRRMNETLESMARAIFKSWFVDFDPIDDVVPGSWLSSSIGEIAASFGGDVLTGPFGSQLHAADYVEEGIPVIMPKNLSEDRVSTNGIARIREEDAERLAKHRLRVGDILMSRRGDVERLALITEREAGWLCGTGCLRIRISTDAVDSQYLFRYLSHPSVRFWIVTHALGTTMPNLNTKIAQGIPFALPPGHRDDVRTNSLQALFERGESNCMENENLTTIRDTLLPKLLSGEIRVSEAEQTVAEVA